MKNTKIHNWNQNINQALWALLYVFLYIFGTRDLIWKHDFGFCDLIYANTSIQGLSVSVD